MHMAESRLARRREQRRSEPPVELIPPNVAELIEERAEVAVEQHLELHTSGPIPGAQALAQYPVDIQERILRMAEATSTDESARRDRVTDSIIQQAKGALRWRYWGMFGAFGCTIATFAFWQNVLISSLFLSVPVMQLIGSTIATSVAQSKEQDDI